MTGANEIASHFDVSFRWGGIFEWKRIEREDEPRRVSLEVMLRGTCDRSRLLDLVENFTLFSEHKAGLVKIIGQNHQLLGVNNAIASMLAARKLGHGRGGVFWQTQGSGKSFLMVFFAQKVLRKVAGNWTFVVVTDRVELDDQIAKTFKATGAVGIAPALFLANDDVGVLVVHGAKTSRHPWHVPVGLDVVTPAAVLGARRRDNGGWF